MKNLQYYRLKLEWNIKLFKANTTLVERINLALLSILSLLILSQVITLNSLHKVNVTDLNTATGWIVNATTQCEK